MYNPSLEHKKEIKMANLERELANVSVKLDKIDAEIFHEGIIDKKCRSIMMGEMKDHQNTYNRTI